MILKMSADGRAQLIRREGFRTKAYRDSVGVWTIGVGHTSAAGAPIPRAGMSITKAEVDEILSRDLGQYEEAVRSAVRVPLSQGQFDALVSFCFNIGASGFQKSTVVRRLNAGNYKGAADALLMWNKPPEIMGRRRSERAQFIAATGAPKTAAAIVKAAPAPIADIPVEETVSADYLRAAGSRTIAGADIAQQGLAGSIASIGGATAALSQMQDVASQAQEAVVAVQSGVGALETLRTYWPLIAVVALTGAAAFFVWRAWRGASLVKVARVDDALSGLHVGR
jgi:lysozyme